MEFVDDLGLLTKVAPKPLPQFVDDLGILAEQTGGNLMDARLPIEIGKPVLRNPDGSVSTEKTITIEADGKHYLIPTIVYGKQLSADNAVKLWRSGKNQAVGVFGSADEAEQAARARSTSIGDAVAVDRMLKEQPTMQTRFEELQKTAGPRGFTYAGRLVTDPTERPEKVLERVPLGEMEAGGLAATGTMDLAAGLALGKGAAALALHPRQAVTGALQAIPGIAEKYRNTVDKMGHAIVERMPKALRAGRGTPIEFREARAQMEADIANGIEQAVTLGSRLKVDLTPAERLRADQLLRGGITTPGTPPQVSAAVAPVRAEIDRIQKELVSLGRLAPETVERFEENFGPYLARLYSSKEFVGRDAVIPFPQPVRAGTDRLKMRGERVEVEIPDLQDEMKAVSRQLGPESEFRSEFRSAAKELGHKGKTTETTVKDTETTLGQERTTKTESKATPSEGEFTEVPLSGVARRLEKIVTDALETRGMTAGEATAAVGRVKAAAVKAAAGGPEVKITSGGTVNETVTETIKERTLRQRETVKNTIEGLGINKAQKAALHAYYDAISRAGAKAKTVQLKGETVTFDVVDPATGQTKKMTRPKTVRIDPVMDIESGAERSAALKPLLDMGYKVESRVGNKVKLFRDIPEEVRTAPSGTTVKVGGREYQGMGELRDQPGYTAAKSIAQTGREASVVRFFKTVSDNPEWTSAVEKPGYVQMVSDKKSMADLAGKFVRSDIAAEINDAVRIKSDLQKINNRITELWKIGKVTNPATIARNFMSSAMLADWGGLSPWKPSGARSYTATMAGFVGADKKTAALLNEAKKGGLFRASYNQAEINLLADGFIKSKGESTMLRFLDGVKEVVNKSKVGQIYGSVDSFYKGALYVHARQELGQSPQLAMRYAKKYGIDYGDISPTVRFMKEVPLGSPFATFASKAIPLTIETAVKHPVRFWKWPAMALGINELSQRAFDSERDEIAHVKELGELQSPRFIQLPTKDKDGRYQFLDLGYILPFGDLLEAFNKISGSESGANIAFEPLGGPYQSLAEVAFNKSLFTGRPIWDRTDSWGTTLAKISDHTLKSLLPALMPPIPGTGFRGGYSAEEFRKVLAPELQLPLEEPISKTDFLGRQRDLLTAVASKIMGVNIKNVSLEDLQRLGLIQFNAKLQELNKKMARVARSGITDAQREAQITKLSEQYKALMEETRRKMRGPESGESGEGGATKPAPQKPKFVDDLGLLGSP
jgi:hypothetical protein